MSSSIHVGRRKSAVARASISRGSGVLTLNGRTFEDYFTTEKLRRHVMEPFNAVEQAGQWDVTARLHGGGSTGQAGALRLAIARALIDYDPELRPTLKSEGLLTRDSRRVERKKAGLKKARKAPQYSKR